MGGPTGVKRVKSGCVTCRIRRVKCDEGKPECKRCLSTGRRCDGYSTLPFSRRDLQAVSQSTTSKRSAIGGSERTEAVLPRLVTDPAFSDMLEKRYFQFFRQRTVASTNSIVDSRFWDRVVLQACHTEPAIKHAVLALSSLHQLNGLASDSDTASQHRLYAAKQHHKALAEARALIGSAAPQDVDRILVACVIFIIFEGVRGDFRAAGMHMDSGRAIVQQNMSRLKHASRRRDLIEIENGLARLDLSAICFSDRTSPYRYTLTDFHNTAPLLTPERFQDLSAAQASFVDLVRWLLLTSKHIEMEHRHGDLESLARYQAEKNRCISAMLRWREHFKELIERSESACEKTILNLWVWFGCATIVMRVSTYGPEMRYDEFTDVFAEMVRRGEKLAKMLAEPGATRSFSFDLGYTIPIYYIATKCRDPSVRRRALAVLYQYPRQEGVWESVAAGTVAARWIEVEEAGLGEVRCAADVPEHRRIRYISTEVSVESGTASVKLTASDVDGPVEVFADWKSGAPDAEEPVSLASDNYLQTCENDKAVPAFDVRRDYHDPYGYIPSETSDARSFEDDKPFVKVEIVSH